AKLLDYSSPSVKLCRGPDGNLRYGAHNLLTHSEDLSNLSVWSHQNVTVTPQGNGEFLVVPDEFDDRAFNAIGPHHDVSWNVGFFYTVSAEFKREGLRYALIGMTNGAGFYVQAVLDLDTGLIESVEGHSSAVSSPSAEVTPVGDGWYRLFLTFNLYTSSSMD